MHVPLNTTKNTMHSFISPSNLSEERSLESHELRYHLLGEVLEVGGLYDIHGFIQLTVLHQRGHAEVALDLGRGGRDMSTIYHV